jgi:transcriptional regulator with XRE-family HTH domain
MTTGEKIIKARISLGISQTKLAEQAGISKQNLYKYEKGIIKNIPIENIKTLAHLLNTTPTYLLGLDDVYLFTDLTQEEITKVLSYIEHLKTIRKC